jgi:formylglycine-generating enzyme required for sulfatase activity
MRKNLFFLILILLVACTGRLPEEIKDKKGAVMRLVPAGEFKMGVADAQQEARPVHTVYLDGFYIDKYEVTNTLYKACVDAGSCTSPKSVEYYQSPSYADFPVVNVDWNMANDYCTWRGGHLPTEAQWEKAARGTDERIYPWGNEISCKNANYFDNSIPQDCGGGLVKVGTYTDGVSPYGVYEMAGNVLEWVADWYDGDVPIDDQYYTNSPASNPQGPATGDRKMVRGGSWRNIPFDLRTTTRNWTPPTDFHFTIGFRCAKAAT